MTDMGLPAPRRLQPATTVAALLAALRRLGWHDATPADQYTAAAGISFLEPVMPARTGHTPARVTVAGETVALGTYDRKGHALEQVTWSWVDAGNLQRVHDYVTAALEDAKTFRGER